LKSSRHKILGLALGEKSLLAAEVAAGPKPRVVRVAEWVYPPGLSLEQPGELGEALREFLRSGGFSANSAILGIPVKWLLVKAKEVPLADTATLTDMLRLQAETEFSSEIKDLVYDYAEGPATETSKSVLLLATQRKHVEWAAELCQGAKLKAEAVMPSALALGRSTGGPADREVLVLASGHGGAELTAQHGVMSSALRHLRPMEPRPAFLSELRRTLSTLPPSGNRREMILWDGGGVEAAEGKASAAALSEQLGLPVRDGELRGLGVDASATNGDGQRFAAAVALALAGLRGPSVDFLHSRLAPPRQRQWPRWAEFAAIAAVVLIGGSIYAYHYLNTQESRTEKLETQISRMKTNLDEANAFVSKVSVAQAWHGGQPRYLACLRDLTEAFPPDGQTYLTNFTLKEATVPSGPTAAKDTDIGKLVGQLDGKTSDQQRALAVPDQLSRNPAFSDVSLVGTSILVRERAVSFSVTFKYDPSKAQP
jgi:hypothetical protein